MISEQMYDYPRRLRWPLELLSAILVGVATLAFGRAAINLVLHEQSAQLGPLITQRAPQLRSVITWLETTGGPIRNVAELLPALGWLLLALLITQFLRNMLPTVRVSGRGILIRWSGDWVPIQWQGLRSLSITEGRGGQSFVVLAQTDDRQLTGWHRLYSLLYRFGWRRGFLITSAIRDGEGLIRHIVEEIERMAEVGVASPITIDDRRGSPFFRMFVGPSDAAPPPSATAQALDLSNAIHAEYRPWVATALFGVTLLLGGLALWHYLRTWITFVYYVFPGTRSLEFMQRLAMEGIQSPWGLLIGAHLGLIAVVVVVGLLYHLFPRITAEGGGLSLTAFGKTQRVPWQHVRMVKATTVREDQHIVLIETDRVALPWWYRIGSWVYEGGIGRGALVWPIAQGFDPLMQRITLELTRQPATNDDAPRLRDDAPGWLILLVIQPADALDQLVEEAQQAGEADQLDRKRVAQELPKMLWIALLPGLIMLASRILLSGDLRPQLIGLLIVTVLWGIAEWPLVGLFARALDDMIGSGAQGYHGLYLYPTAQLPRLLPLAGALVLTLLGFPTLALLVWAAGIAWSAILTAGLWEALYGWHGQYLIAGSAMTVLFQILTLLGIVIST